MFSSLSADIVYYERLNTRLIQKSEELRDGYVLAKLVSQSVGNFGYTCKRTFTNQIAIFISLDTKYSVVFDLSIFNAFSIGIFDLLSHNQ